MSDADRGHEFVGYILDLAGPIAALFSKLPASARPEVAAEIAREVERADGGSARLTGVTWVAEGLA